MYNDKNLDNMTQRYKDEMMRIYRDQQKKQASGSNQSPVVSNIPTVSETEINSKNPVNPVNSAPKSLPPVVSQDTNAETTTTNSTYNYSKQIIDKTEQSFVKCPVFPSHDYRPIKPVEKASSETMTTSKFRSPQEILNEITNNEAPANRITSNQEEKPLQDVTPETTGTTNNNMMSRDMFTVNPDMDMPKPPDIPVPEEVQRELDIIQSANKPVKEHDEEISTDDTNYNMSAPDSNIGYLQVETSVSNQAITIAGATVIVSKTENGKTSLVKALKTDKSGKTETIPLPAPPKSYSEDEGNAEVEPYAKYTIRVEAQGFYPEENIDVPIFATVKSIQPFQLVPLPEYTPEETQSAISSK